MQTGNHKDRLKMKDQWMNNFVLQVEIGRSSKKNGSPVKSPYLVQEAYEYGRKSMQVARYMELVNLINMNYYLIIQRSRFVLVPECEVESYLGQRKKRGSYGF